MYIYTCTGQNNSVYVVVGVHHAGLCIYRTKEQKILLYIVIGVHRALVECSAHSCAGICYNRCTNSYNTATFRTLVFRSTGFQAVSSSFWLFGASGMSFSNFARFDNLDGPFLQPAGQGVPCVFSFFCVIESFCFGRRPTLRRRHRGSRAGWRGSRRARQSRRRSPLTIHLQSGSCRRAGGIGFSLAVRDIEILGGSPRKLQCSATE
jgi:hypothetical protein